jgi:glycosyltransferase involved in cell wall biosynthesis
VAPRGVLDRGACSDAESGRDPAAEPGGGALRHHPRVTRRTVLAVIHTPSYGGPHNQIAVLARPLAAAGWRYVVATTDESGDGVQRLREAEVEVRSLPLGRPRRPLLSKRNVVWAATFWRDVRALRHVAVATRADVVQVCGLLYPQGAFAARVSNLPLVWQLLGMFPPPPARLVLTPLVVRLADVVMTAGETTARAHASLQRTESRRFYPPVDTSRFRPDANARERTRTRLGFAPDEVVIGTIANVVPEKRLDLLAHAAGIAVRVSQGPLRLVLAGRVPAGQERYWQRIVAPALRDAEAHGVRVTVLLDPDPDAIPDLHRGLDVFCLTSRVEGVPTTVLEALASGVPIVATAAGGVREVVAPGAGCVSPIESSASSLGEMLGRLVDHGTRRKVMGRAAREAAARYTPERCASQHVDAFEEAVRHRGARTGTPAAHRPGGNNLANGGPAGPG